MKEKTKSWLLFFAWLTAVALSFLGFMFIDTKFFWLFMAASALLGAICTHLSYGIKSPFDYGN